MQVVSVSRLQLATLRRATILEVLSASEPRRSSSRPLSAWTPRSASRAESPSRRSGEGPRRPTDMATFAHARHAGPRAAMSATVAIDAGREEARPHGPGLRSGGVELRFGGPLGRLRLAWRLRPDRLGLPGGLRAGLLRPDLLPQESRGGAIGCLRVDRRHARLQPGCPVGRGPFPHRSPRSARRAPRSRTSRCRCTGGAPRLGPSSSSPWFSSFRSRTRISRWGDIHHSARNAMQGRRSAPPDDDEDPAGQGRRRLALPDHRPRRRPARPAPGQPAELAPPPEIPAARPLGGTVRGRLGGGSPGQHDHRATSSTGTSGSSSPSAGMSRRCP